MRPHQTTIVLVHTHRLVRAALRCLLEQRGLSVSAEAASSAEARAAVRAAQPDIVLTDLEVGGESVLPVLPALLAASPRSGVIVMAPPRDARAHAQAIDAGALGIVLTDEHADTLVSAIERVRCGERRIAPAAPVPPVATRRRVEIDPEVRKIQSLTRREREIVERVGEGLKNRHIAGRLFISEATVRNHMTSVLDKLDLDDRFELAVYAFRHGLVSYAPPSAAVPSPELPARR